MIASHCQSESQALLSPIRSHRIIFFSNLSACRSSLLPEEPSGRVGRGPQSRLACLVCVGREPSASGAPSPIVHSSTRPFIHCETREKISMNTSSQSLSVIKRLERSGRLLLCAVGTGDRFRADRPAGSRAGTATEGGQVGAAIEGAMNAINARLNRSLAGWLAGSSSASLFTQTAIIFVTFLLSFVSLFVRSFFFLPFSLSLFGRRGRPRRADVARCTIGADGCRDERAQSKANSCLCVHPRCPSSGHTNITARLIGSGCTRSRLIIACKLRTPLRGMAIREASE